ncbi:hypothetical protein C8J56DRAFT_1042036 [Mycena floridula]|nr:hypothetical protein C8J56DRAFT_1042036 [Mycena floridula]
MFGKTVDQCQIQVGETGVNIWLQAISVACADITSIFASVAAAYLNATFGRRVAIRLGAISTLAVLQIFTPNLPWLITSRALLSVSVFSRQQFQSINAKSLQDMQEDPWFGYALFFQMPSNITWRAPYMIQAFLSLILIIWSL